MQLGGCLLTLSTPDPHVFSALADATRLSILERLGEGNRLSTTQLAEATGMSRQAVRKHLGVLAEAGLVRHRREGRTRWWVIDARPLLDVSEWAASYSKHWEERFDRLDEFLASTEQKDVS